ncbi:ribonuclease H-like domain-containing protein [Tanacetum coccineum]
MLADSLLPTVFWAEAINTTCYVLNRVLVTKPHNKTPYELIIGRAPIISFLRPFGCPVTILNTLDPLGKFDGKAEEGFLACFLHALRFDFELCHCLYRLCHLRSLILETTCSYFCFILKASNSELAEVFVLILELHDRNVL